MNLDRFITANRIIDLSSDDLTGALRELIGTCDFEEIAQYGKKRLLRELLDREQTMTTNLGNGVALPHLRLPLKRRYLLAIGRCPRGLSHEGSEDYADIRLVVLLLASTTARNYLNALSTLAGTFQDQGQVRRLVEAEGIVSFRREVRRILSGESRQPSGKPTRINRLILREAEKIANATGCRSVLLFGDTFAGGIELTDNFQSQRTLLITRSGAESVETEGKVSEVLSIRAFSANRMSQLRSAILIGLTRGLLAPDELVCCVGGLPQSNRFDTILIVDVAREFRALFSSREHAVPPTLPPTLRPEVLERVLAIATELGMEGREGRKVGCLFVLGDTQKVLEYSKPLVLNPFHGYREEERNVLNPFMDETVKEFSSLDGAFIIRGNGVIEAAGTLLRAPDYPDLLPSGLGARHAAAAAITKSTRSVAIVVSESTGQVTLFADGDLVPLLGHPLGGNF